jgi:hypothetical protein
MPKLQHIEAKVSSRGGTREGYYKKMWPFLLEKLTKKYLNCHYVQFDQSAILDKLIWTKPFWLNFWPINNILIVTIYMILNILIIIYYNK